MGQKAAPPPTGLDALPKAAAAALPKDAAAALEAQTATAPAPAAHPLLQKLMAGKAAKGEEVTKLHLSVEMMPQVSFMMGSLGDLGIYYDILSGVG